MKLAIEKERDVPEVRAEVTKLLTVTMANEVEPLHWMAEFTF